MAPSPRIKIAVISALVAGGALAAAGQAGAQPAPVDPMLPPVPGVAAPAPAPNQVFTYTPVGEVGPVPGPAPAPPPIGAPYIAPVENGSFNNTGQMSFLRELWNMRNPADFYETLYAPPMDPAMADAMGVRQMPMLAPGELPPGVVAPEAAPSVPAAAGAPAVPAPAPPPVWPPVGMVPLPTP